MAKRVSVKAARRDVMRQEKQKLSEAPRKRTHDSFQNFLSKTGVGTGNLSDGGRYGFNPITRERTLLEWIHRGSWLGGLAVDLPADDMTRAGVTLEGSQDPEVDEKLEELATELRIWEEIRDTVAWGRLYGGGIGVHMIDGQDYSTPLRLESVGPGQYRGILPMDRWMVTPSMEDLITEPGPNIGLPKYYYVTQQGSALRGMRIHYSRVFRMEGVRLPYWQRLTENMWGESVLERLYDRLMAFDSATTGAAQLVYKAHLRTLKVKDLRELVATGGEALDGLVAYVLQMARFQSSEGVTLIDGEDEFNVNEIQSAYAGLAELLVHFGQQFSGGLQVPMVRLFGQSPTGLNSSGESDLRTYYDGINKEQKRDLKRPVTLTYRLMARSLGIILPPGFGVTFRSLWQLPEKEKADVANTIVDAMQKAADGGFILRETGTRELKTSSATTGVFTGIGPEDEKNAKEIDEAPPMDEAAGGEGDGEGEPPPPGGKEKEVVN